MTAGCGLAEDTDKIIDSLQLSEMQRAADGLDAGIDVKATVLAIAAGETRLDGEFLRDTWEKWRSRAVSHFRDTLIAFMGPLFISAVFMRLFPWGKDAGGLVCACACTAVFADAAAEAAITAKGLIGGLAAMLEAVVPVLTGLSALGGGTSSAALISPMAALAGEIMVGMLGGTGISLGCAAGACACACAISRRLRLDGIFTLIKKAVQTGAGFILAVFAGILKVQGMLGASFDSAAVKTARFAVDRIVPVVGGGISDTMDAAISSVMLINSAVGVTGMLVIAASCAYPILKLAAALIAVRVARAAAEPLADGPVMETAERFGDVIRLFLVLCITAVTISLVLIGAAVGAGRSLS